MGLMMRRAALLRVGGLDTALDTAPKIKAALNAGKDLAPYVREQAYCTRGNGVLTWDIADYDANEQSVVLMMHDAGAFPSNVQFEPPQALEWCADGRPAGAYKFKNGNNTYYFTLATAVPAGGQICANTRMFTTYSSQDSIIALETGTVSTTEIAGATDLGTCGTGNLNYMYRVDYSSNNFAESAMVNYLLNSDTAAGTVVHGRTKLCRAWTMPFDGFLRGLDPSFLAAVSTEDWKCSANTEYECPAELGGLATKGQPYTFSAKFALASKNEVFGSSSGVNDGTSRYDLFVGATSNDRKRYRGSSAQGWWLRSPGFGSPFSVSYVATNGAGGDYPAESSYAIIPICKIKAD